MSADLKPPEIHVTESESLNESLTEEELESVASGTRTPRPYHRDGDEIQQDREGLPHAVGVEEDQWKTPNGQESTAGSESGTEADDERRSFVKALPAPHLRPRKGLKVGELNEEVLLTPSQLDDEGRRLSDGYFHQKPQDKKVSVEEEREEQEKLLRIRRAEFLRRTSEVGLTATIILCVLCGNGVLRTARHFRYELLAHVAIIASLILVYPIKLSIVDTASQARKLWHRFRVPASFDPATVLYPPLLPVLVALSISSTSSAPILPNVILGLASLPQRLFPRSSRLGGFNVLHWFISILPLVVAERTMWASNEVPKDHYTQKCPPHDGLCSETLVLLYPLHHALLQPLHYLTTTSLLISELHLLSAALINLLLLAGSPQIIMLKACLWIGGVSLFVFCASVLHWNVTLMRVPKWKLRRPGHTAEERKSLVDAVSELINLQKAAAAFKSTSGEDSDADEDEPQVSIKQKPNRRPRLSVTNVATAFDGAYPKSAVEPRQEANGTFPDFNGPFIRPRRNTLPEKDAVSFAPRQLSSRRREHSSHLLWCLHLTPDQAQRRKWLYAGYVYAVIIVVIMFPVRQYVQNKALEEQEPLGWAVGYLFGQVGPVRDVVNTLNLQRWISLPYEPGDYRDLQLTIPLDVPMIRSTIGAANMRLVLIGYWGAVLLAGLLAVFSLTAYVEVDTRRKVFHGVMVAMMLPSTFVDPCACALALALILAVFLLLEVIRAGQIPPLGSAIGRFVAPYVDGRDLRGPVVVSHIFLLIGCAVPLWFSLASIPHTGKFPWVGWQLVDEKREVAMNAGVICVGMGDAAASLIGRRYGRHKWIWVGGKSLEGSAAFAAAVTIGLVATKVWLVLGGWNDNDGSTASHVGDLGLFAFALAWSATLCKAMFCACGASFMEAVLTGANDNVVVPIALWLLVKGLRV